MHRKTIKLIYFSLGGSEVREVNLSWRAVLLAGLITTTLLGVFAAGILAIFTDFFKDIRLKNLAKANETLNVQLVEMGTQIDLIQSSIKDLEKTDNDMRIVLDLETIDDASRNMGVGGSSRDLDYTPTSLGYSANMKAEEFKDLLDELERRTKLLQASRHEIERRHESNQDLYNHTPSIVPVEGARITDYFTPRRKHPLTGKWGPHEGVDFGQRRGTPVRSTAYGTVVVAKSRYKPNNGYGKEVVIDHGFGFQTRYAHLSKILVKEGQEVARHEIIGLLGDTGRTTGPHVHYEVIKDGRRVDPLHYVLDLD